MAPTSRLEIDRAALRHNLRLLRRLLAPGAGLCPVVKADGYGLGARIVTPLMLDEHVRFIAVYTPEQALDLVDLLVAGAARAIVLMPFAAPGPEPVLEPLVRADAVELVVHEPSQIRSLAGLAAATDARVPVHIEVDTGMARGGCEPDAIAALAAEVLRTPGLALRGVMSQFASADSDPQRTEAQHRRFCGAVASISRLLPPDALIHIANTCGTLRSVRYHASMVRVGQGWVGIGREPLAQSATPSILDGAGALTPIVRWRAQLALVRDVAAGCQVGYGATWRAPVATRLGLVPVGYADGWPRSMGTTPGRPAARVMVETAVRGGRLCGWAAIVGAVNMDQMTIDLGDVVQADGTTPLTAPERRAIMDHAARGTAVELITPDPAACTHLGALAASARTNALELLCRLSPRLPRVIVPTAMATGGMPSPMVDEARPTRVQRTAVPAPGATDIEVLPQVRATIAP
ncbi:MAG: alanine racemase [Phycisphaeraceae bacterium]|nr:alanine racemase [Phycisphaeraceae bacterium]